MSQLGQFSFDEVIETLTGNSGDIVHPQVGNVNIRGTDHLTVVGNNTTATLSINMDGEIADTYTTDSGNAVPSANILRVLGGDNINTAGATNAVTIHLDTSIVQPVTSADGLSGLYSLGSNRFMHARGTNNTFLGDTAGSLSLTVATAVGNTGLGSAVLTGITSAAYNVGVGASALTLVTSGVANTAVGALAGSLMNGSGNTLLGKEAGISYTGAESYNIAIGNSGTVGESNKIRIGTYGTGAGQQDTAYIAGVVHASNGLTADAGDIVCTSGNITASTGNINVTTGYIEVVDDNVYIGNKAVSIIGPDLQFKKSRNSAVISAGDVLGNIKFSGFDGTSYDVAAQITSLSSGTIGTGRIAADLQFWTSPDVAGIALRRMDVKPTGEVYIYTPDSGVGLTIQGRGETITAGNLELTDGNIFVDNPAVSSDGSDINFRKSRASATVVNADNLGNLVYWGHDGTNYILASAIISNVTATPATNKIPSNLEFWTHPDSTVASTKRVTIESSGTVTVNAPDSGNAMNISGNVAMLASSADHIATELDFKKSHGGAAISAGDELGNITFQGYDGANYVIGAAIIADTNGTPGTNRIPTQLQFWTHPDSTTAALQRLTIASTGEVTIASPDSGAGLTISGGGETITSGDLTLSSGNINLPTTSSTVGQVKFNSTLALHTKGTSSAFFGENAGNVTQTRSNNTGIGYNALMVNTNGDSNTAVGCNSLDSYGATASIGANSAFGVASGAGLTTGSYNVFFGKDTGIRLTTGDGNLLVGTFNGSPYGAGYNYTSSESYNICIGNAGTTGESHKIRIGTAGSGNNQQDAVYIAGAYGVTPGGTINVALVDSNGQFGSTSSLPASLGGAVVWTEVTGTSQAAATGNGYITNNAALVTVTLPASATVGQVVEINGKGAGLWKLAQNSGQTIHFGSIDTTTGTGGYLAATVRYDCVSVRCITANTDWVVYSSSGTITIV